MNLNFDKSQKLVLILIIFGIISRVIPHPPNFSPLTAIALFGGLNFNNKKIALGGTEKKMAGQKAQEYFKSGLTLSKKAKNKNGVVSLLLFFCAGILQGQDFPKYP